MRFMIIVKATKNSEAGVLPSEKLIAEMTKYNEELAKAGVLLAGEGLQASSKGARVKFSGEKRTVTDGPFAETKELVAGFWIWSANRWKRRSNGSSAALTLCRAKRRRSRFARCSKPRTSAPPYARTPRARGTAARADRKVQRLVTPQIRRKS